jgi:uncharacterized membrane protein
MRSGILLLAFLNLLAYYFVLKALGIGDQSNVTLVTSTSGILIIILGILVLRERAHIREKLTAGLMVGVAMALLAG